MTSNVLVGILFSSNWERERNESEGEKENKKKDKIEQERERERIERERERERDRIKRDISWVKRKKTRVLTEKKHKSNKLLSKSTRNVYHLESTKAFIVKRILTKGPGHNAEYFFLVRISNWYLLI